MTWCREAEGGGRLSSSTKQALAWLADVAAWLPLWGGEATVIPLVHRRAQTRQVWLTDHLGHLGKPWVTETAQRHLTQMWAGLSTSSGVGCGSEDLYAVTPQTPPTLALPKSKAGIRWLPMWPANTDIDDGWF